MKKRKIRPAQIQVQFHHKDYEKLCQLGFLDDLYDDIKGILKSYRMTMTRYDARPLPELMSEIR